MRCRGDRAVTTSQLSFSRVTLEVRRQQSALSRDTSDGFRQFLLREQQYAGPTEP